MYFRPFDPVQRRLLRRRRRRSTSSRHAITLPCCFEHIRLQGSEAFIERTRAALACLRQADSYAEVWNFLVVLRTGERSGVAADEDVPFIDVGFKVWSSPTIWYASAIAHEGFHIKLYRDERARSGYKRPKLTAWAGVEAEKKCLAFQLRILEQLKAEEHHLTYVQELEKAPTYQGDPLSWEDYLRRNW